MYAAYRGVSIRGHFLLRAVPRSESMRRALDCRA